MHCRKTIESPTSQATYIYGSLSPSAAIGPIFPKAASDRSHIVSRPLNRTRSVAGRDLDVCCRCRGAILAAAAAQTRRPDVRRAPGAERRVDEYLIARCAPGHVTLSDGGRRIRCRGRSSGIMAQRAHARQIDRPTERVIWNVLKRRFCVVRTPPVGCVRRTKARIN
jgi:hypothetical protein